MKKKLQTISYKHSATSSSKGFKLIQLNKLGKNNADFDSKILYDYHQIEFFAILIITSKEVKHMVDFKVAQLHQGDCLIITKGQVHAFDKASHYEGSLLLFSEEFLQRHITPSAISQIPFLYKQAHHQLIFSKANKNQLFISLLQECIQEDKKILANQVGSLLSYFLLDVVEESSEEVTYSRNQALFFRFQNSIAQKHQHTRNAKDYAKVLEVSYKHLNDICKHMVNKTAKKCIDDYMILEAKRQLVLGTLTVKEIGFKLGFNETTNFRKYFQKQTSVSPNDFLRKMKLVTH